MLSALTLAAAMAIAAPASPVSVGDLFVIKATGEGTIPEAVEFMGRKFPAIRDPATGQHFFLLAVDLDGEPGEYPLAAHGAGGGGSPIVIEVREKEFPVERLTLDTKMVTPPEEVLERIARERDAAAAVYGSTSAEALWQPPFRRPVEGEPSGNFGRKRILNDLPRSPHSGEDYSAPRGTVVRAVASGLVRMAEELYYSGKTVLVDHGAGLVSQYFHLDETLVAAGGRVERGQEIGRVGSTGRVTGPHLHFGVRLFGMRADPSRLWEIFPGEE